MKKQLLDPLGTMCKLVGLNFSQLKTKLSIHNHVLELDEPSDIKGYNIQGVFRTWWGDGKENISELYYVIIRIIKWYLIRENMQIVKQKIDIDAELGIKSSDKYGTESDEDDLSLDLNFQDDTLEEEIKSIGSNKSNNSVNVVKISESETIRKMISYLCIALSKLQETYEFGNVVLAIQFFINLLQDALEGRFDEKKLPKYIIMKEKEYESLIDYDKLKGLWDLKTLETICGLYDQCFKVMEDKDMPNKTRQALIEGYLKTINATLEITDKEFQTLIMNNQKG